MSSICINKFPLGTIFTLITKKYVSSLYSELEGMPIDRYFSVLMLLDKEQRALNQQYISDELGFDKTAMVRMMDYLMEEGMVEKELNPVNRREYLVSLTAKSRKVLPEIKQVVCDLNKKVFTGVSAADTKMFFDVLEKLNENLSHHQGDEVIIEVKSLRKKKKK
jgi:DNA-binding MarR family transcriptional regulator